MICLFLPWTEPGQNLAAEEFLLDAPASLPPGETLLLAYENSECIVIGKNQNPWREISPAVLRSGAPRFFRRASGDGAVWHGPGNLNFALITPQAGFSKEAGLDFVRRALGRPGVSLERTHRGDLLAGGKKVSGNALAYRRGRVLHHGTLLVNARLADISRCLAAASGAAFEIETRGIASFPLPVANLADFVPGLTVSRAADALFEEARAAFAARRIDAGEIIPREKLEPLISRHASADWLYAATPDFFCRVGNRRLEVKAGVIVSVLRRETPEGGFAGTAAPEPQSAWLGKPFGFDALDYFAGPGGA